MTVRIGRSVARRLPLIVVSPALEPGLFVVYWVILSKADIFTRSGVMPVYEFNGLAQYGRLWATPRLYVAIRPPLVLWSLFIKISESLCILRAILPDRRVRAEGAIGEICPYPMALSVIVTATGGKWLHIRRPVLERLLREAGVGSFALTRGQPGPAGTVPGLIRVRAAYGSAFTTRFFRKVFVDVSGGILPATNVDGAGISRFLFGVVLPVSLANIVVKLIWPFTKIWEHLLFGVACTIDDSSPVTVALNNLVSTSPWVTGYAVSMAATILTAKAPRGQFGDMHASLGASEVIEGGDPEIEPGAFVAPVGTSDCGKSMRLNIIAGRETAPGGDIRIGDGRANDGRPRSSDVAMAFRSCALHPAKRVRKTMFFGMQTWRLPKEAQRETIKEFGQFLQVHALPDRKPDRLAGGQRQRAAMGRTPVPKPDVVLFDEPPFTGDSGTARSRPVRLRTPDGGGGSDQPRHEDRVRHRRLKTDRPPPAIGCKQGGTPFALYFDTAKAKLFDAATEAVIRDRFSRARGAARQIS